MCAHEGDIESRLKQDPYDERANWNELKTSAPLSECGQGALEDEAGISEFRALVHRARTDAGLSQGELADRMATAQSTLDRIEAGGVRPTTELLSNSHAQSDPDPLCHQAAPVTTTGGDQLTDSGEPPT